MKRPFRSLLLAGAVALALAGCGGDKPITHATPTPAPVPSATPAVAQPTPSPAPTPAPTPEPAPESSPTPEPAAGVDSGWLDREAPFVLEGVSGLELVVAEARIGEDDLTIALLPAGNEAAFAAFQESGSRLPPMEIGFDAEAGALLLRLENTVLASGEVSGDDWVFDFIEEHGMSYPASTPAGLIGEDNAYFEKAAISSDGTDTTISLLLTGESASYRVECGGLDGDEMRPFLRLAFRGLD